MAIYEQMRQQISPQEFSNEMLAGASQVDPQAVAEFTEELQSLDVSPEELDALNDLVDQILANPEQYDQLRQQYLAQGMPDDILPEQFDPYFFAALNMAVDQMIAAPTGVQAFAKGGIAELKPIAKAIASYGRNGDTMLAHITPAEARMLKRRGGSGTINPATGLPEFFLKKAFKSIGKAVKKFASSSVGRLVTTVALGYFLGPMAVKAMGIASGTMAAAAVSGFVGGAGGSLLAGGNLKDALKSGAIAGLTAGAAAGLGGARLTGAPVVDAPMAVPGAGASGASAVPGAPAISATGEVANMAAVPAPGASSAAYDLNMQAQQAARIGVPSTAAPYSDLSMTGTPSKPFPEFFGNQPATAGTPAGYKPPTIGESFSKMGEGLGMGDKAASFETFKQGATDLFSPGPTDAQVSLRAREIMSKTPGTSLKDAMSLASKDLGAPGFLRTYGPAAVAGTGIMALSGGFDTKPVEGGPITQSLMKPVTQRIAEEGTQRQMYMQGLPGVVYDEFGAPVFGKSTRLPTYDVPDYNYGGFNMPGAGAGGQGDMNLPSVYIPPPGTIGSRRVEQPYNTSSMYTNLLPPQRYAGGGQVQYFDDGGDVAPPPVATAPVATAPAKTPEQLAAERQAALETMMAQQKAGRDIANQRRAERRAGGSGQMYANINAGLAALAPENNPMDLADTGFGARNRQAQMAALQQQYSPMLLAQKDAMYNQNQALANARGINAPAQRPAQPYNNANMYTLPRAPVTNKEITEYLAANPGMTDAQIRAAMDQFGVGTSQMATATGLPFEQVQQRYAAAAPARLMNMGGIAALAQGGYPRRTGQISGPGTEKSDSIPAMLSDGEFVLTAKAVRGADPTGKGNRRAGAKQMYKLMHQLEKNSERG
jgi:hypothetical protein